MYKKPLVSIITPAYNTAKYINKLLDSILNQSYPVIEMIVINDGSTDNTEEIIKSYASQFEKKGYTLNYYYQENSGQSVAINKALKLVKGKYLVWPDSDDYYSSSDTIERMVNEFENGDMNLGMVRTQERIIEDREDGIKVKAISGTASKPYYKAGELFEDCLYANGYYFVPGAYMLNLDKLSKCNGLEIFTAKEAGQNWQLMLPMLYSYDCLTILEPLYNVIERTGSHSRGQYKGYEAEAAKYKTYEQTILSTLDKIDMPHNKREYYKQQIVKKYRLELFNVAFYNAQDAKGLDLFYQLPIEEQKRKTVRFKKLLMQCRLTSLLMSSYKMLIQIYKLFR